METGPMRNLRTESEKRKLLYCSERIATLSWYLYDIGKVIYLYLSIYVYMFVCQYYGDCCITLLNKTNQQEHTDRRNRQTTVNKRTKVGHNNRREGGVEMTG